MNKREKRRTCEHCLHAFKNYFSIGNRLFFKNAVSCCAEAEIKKGKDFKEKVNCERFVPDRMPAPHNDTEQKIFYLSKQIDEVIDILFDIIEILTPTEDDGAEE